MYYAPDYAFCHIWFSSLLCKLVERRSLALALDGLSATPPARGSLQVELLGGTCGSFVGALSGNIV